MSGSKTYFQQVAENWDTLQQSFFSKEVRESAYNKAGIQAGTLAVDAGCGTGFITEGLLKRGVRVVAVDQSENMLNVLKNKFSGTDGLDLRIGDSENLPLGNNEADYVFANMYLHHVESPPDAIKEMVRVLKKGGKLIITDMDEHNFEFLRAEHNDIWLGFKRENLAKWFTEAGLINIEVESAGTT